MSIWSSLPGDIRASERYQETTDEYAGTGEREVLVDVAYAAVGTVRLGFYRSTPDGEPYGEDWYRAAMILEPEDVMALIDALETAYDRVVPDEADEDDAAERIRRRVR